MIAVAAYAGIIVSQLERSAAWYAEVLEVEPQRAQDGWVKLPLGDGSEIELVAGDLRHPGYTFPSYGKEHGPPVMAGYSVEDADEAAAGLDVVRRLPGWVVVIAPDRLRLVLCEQDSRADSGLVGFRYTSTAAAEQQAFLTSIDVVDVVTEGEAVRVVPVIAAGRDATLVDPDGTVLECVSGATMAPAGA
jgi:catechol 2,3-dioxygenase-like lactoylglutathione lyase family enzyme